MADNTPLPSIVSFSVDLSTAEAPAPLPAGEYRGTIRSASPKVSQNGKKYAEVAFYIGSEQYPVDHKDGNPDGTTIMFRRVSLEDTPQGRYGARRFLESIGAPLGKRIDLTEWSGREAAVEVGHETYEGVARAVIQRVRAL